MSNYRRPMPGAVGSASSGRFRRAKGAIFIDKYSISVIEDRSDLEKSTKSRVMVTI